MPAKGIFKKKHTQKNLKELKLKLKSCIKKVKSYIKLYKKVKKKNHEEKPNSWHLGSQLASFTHHPVILLYSFFSLILDLEGPFTISSFSNSTRIEKQKTRVKKTKPVFSWLFQGRLPARGEEQLQSQ